MTKPFYQHPLFLTLSCFLVLFLFLYQDYGGGNHNQYLVQYYRAQDPSYLANDWYANVTEGYTVRYYFTSLLLFSSYLFSSDRIMFFVLTLLFTLGLGVCLYYFSFYFYQDTKKSILFSLFVYTTLDTTFIGTAPIFSANLTPNMIAYVFSFLCFNFLLRKKYWLGFFILSFATFFQPIISGICFLFGLLIVFYHEKNNNEQCILK